MAIDREMLRGQLSRAGSTVRVGRVVGVTGMTVTVSIPGARVGDLVRVTRGDNELVCEVVALREGIAVALSYGTTTGIGVDDEVMIAEGGAVVSASEALLGRVVDGLGRPIDGGPEVIGVDVPLDRDPPNALIRAPIDRPLVTGVRVIDGLLTLGEGQRIGLFSGSGVGKSTLLAAIARHVRVDVVVVAMVGERGREVRGFLEEVLGAEARKRAICVVATSDASALERMRAAFVATAYGEYFRGQGKRVLLLVDSVTRLARASREIGLAAGEAPARRGYPPSTFALLPRLLERAGNDDRGTMTAVYTVLVEGGDLDEPVADEVRGILDGHVVLDRELAARGRYPAVDVPRSISRVMERVVSPGHKANAARLTQLLAHYESKRDLVTLGAYTKGADRELDFVISKIELIERFLRQSPEDPSAWETTLADLAQTV